MDEDAVWGCGCLTLLLAIFGGIGWLFYDGYYDRRLPDGEVAKVLLTARIESPERYQLQPNIRWPAGSRHALVITVENNSRYVVTEVYAHERFYSADPAPIERWAPCEPMDPKSPKVLPGAVSIDWCAVPMSSSTADIIDSSDFKRWEWYAPSIKGHRLPRRIVKAPVDWVRSLLERVPE